MLNHSPSELSRLAYEAIIAGAPDAAELARAAAAAYLASIPRVKESKVGKVS